MRAAVVAVEPAPGPAVEVELASARPARVERVPAAVLRSPSGGALAWPWLAKRPPSLVPRARGPRPVGPPPLLAGGVAVATVAVSIRPFVCFALSCLVVVSSS